MENHDSYLSTLMVRMLHLARSYLAASDKVLAPYGITHAVAWPALMISRMGDGIKTGALAEAIRLEPSSVVRVIDQMIEHDIVERRDDPKDRRVRQLFLTDKGKKLVKQIEKIMDPFRQELFKGIPEDDLAVMMRVLQQLLEAVERYRN